jgi:hypothetical protein
MAPRARAAAVLLAVALVAGCGDDDDDDDDAAAVSSTTTTTETTDGGDDPTSTTTTTAGTAGTEDSTPSTTGGEGPDDPEDPADGGTTPEEAGEAPDVLTDGNTGDTYRVAERRIISLRLSNPPTWGDPTVEGDAVSLQLQPYEVDPGFTEYVIFADSPGRSVVRFAGDREVVLTFDVYEN